MENYNPYDSVINENQQAIEREAGEEQERHTDNDIDDKYRKKTKEEIETTWKDLQGKEAGLNLCPKCGTKKTPHMVGDDGFFYCQKCHGTIKD